MKSKKIQFTCPHTLVLEQENARLYEEVLTARKASDITARMVSDQFARMEKVLRQLEDKISEEKELRKKVSQKNRYLAALNETNMDLMSKLDLTELLTAIMKRACELLNSNHGCIYLYNPEARLLERKIEQGLFCHIAKKEIESGFGLSGRVFQADKTIVINDYNNWTGRPSIRKDMIRAIMGVPLHADLRVTGVISLAYGFNSKQIFGQEESELLERFAQLASMAIENARLYSEAHKAQEAAETANRAKSTFLANMSHELRTPLNAIIGYSEMLMEDAQDLEQEDFIPDLQKIHSAGKHLLSLINDILDLSKVEAGKMDLFLENFDVEPMINEVIDTIKPLADKNKNTLKLNFINNPGTIYADLTKLRQSLFNLLSNACKFTDQGQITLNVDKQEKDNKEYVIFSVSDSGIGMNEDQMKKLFKVFSQADDSITRKFGGTGLGLVITRLFCKMMGGDVTVKSREGHGTTFTINIPAAVTRQESVLNQDAGSKAEVIPGRKQTVLVIDDDFNARELMKRFLHKEGFSVETASGGKEGLEKARAVRPDLITLDVMMPEIDGWSVLTILKTDPDLSDIPVIMLTMIDDKNMGFALGASEYMVKPVNYNRLASLLDKYQKVSNSSPVLIVEDNEDVRDMLQRMTQKQGYNTVTAKNGKEGLEQLSSIYPGLILLDLMMPEMDGFQFIEELRKNDLWQSIPVIIITAKDITAEDRIRLNGYVEKILLKGSYGKDELLEEIRSLIPASIK
ncbi:Two component system response regulator histidine kinase, GAF domain-containing [Desulfonema limicola]|uniref:histidine kinase n=1 Tax=Desulfonema limicola TaxID=45656 RepID=A0A975GJV8_9BACT|nr:response regulator [Desulfonema limicola]QTA83937.1 Two component system response regulator histidine kinase, GAF domain-containing [Desulfonema limicola]